MRFFLIPALAATTLLAGCMDAGNTSSSGNAAASAQDPLFNALVDKSFARGDFVISFGADGVMRGTNPTVTGTWEVRNGKFCRTITEPAEIAGSECQSVTINGDTYTFTGSSGVREYTLVR